MGQTLAYDRRDSRIDPTAGYLLSLSNQYAGLGGKVNYLKNSIGATWFYSPIEDVVKLVNQGGKSEHVFHALKSAGWEYPPFSFMNQNLVFFILTALANNVYEAVLMKFKETFPKLNIDNIRLTKFRKKFINIICEVIDGIFYFDEGGVDIKKLM